MSNEQFESSGEIQPSSSELGQFDQSEQQMPLGAGGFGEGDDAAPFLEDEAKPRFKSGSVIIVLVVLTAVAAVMGMRTLSQSTNAAFAANNTEVDAQIESFLDALTDADTPRGDGAGSDRKSTVIDVLNTTYAERQVAIEDVKKNPFITDADAASTDPDPTSEPTVDAYEVERDALRKSFDAASKRVTINTIMAGSNPLASLNGKIVRQGGTLVVDGVEFLIESITTNDIVIVASSEEYDLESSFTISVK